jgi:hypothetical protein
MVLAGRLLASRGLLAVLVKKLFNGSAVSSMELAFALLLPDAERFAELLTTAPLASKRLPASGKRLFVSDSMRPWPAPSKASKEACRSLGASKHIEACKFAGTR